MDAAKRLRLTLRLWQLDNELEALRRQEAIRQEQAAWDDYRLERKRKKIATLLGFREPDEQQD
jgi:hypothetical protein